MRARSGSTGISTCSPTFPSGATSSPASEPNWAALAWRNILSPGSSIWPSSRPDAQSRRLRDGGASIPEFRSAENAIDAGLLFAPSGVALGHGVVSPASIRQRCRWNPEGATAKARWNNRVKRAHEAEGTSNELMPRAVSRRRRDQLVARLETLHTSIPNAEESMAKAPFNHSQSAPAIEPPIDRRCARAAEHPPRRLPPTAGHWGFRDEAANG